MKTIYINFCGFSDEFDSTHNVVFPCSLKHYDVVISNEPQYLFCSLFRRFYDYCKYPCVRIIYSGENYFPDLNLIDYSISSYKYDVNGRNVFFPECFMGMSNNSHFIALLDKNRNYLSDFLLSKPLFANFITSHESENGLGGAFFKRLNSIKRVESAGSFLNNMPNGEKVDRLDGSKVALQKKCKFTLCFESTCHETFISEKIIDAFYSDTIPIYCGSTVVEKIFNPKAFIHIRSENDFDAAIKKIIELDSNDEKYLEMLRQPIFTENDYYSKKIEELDSFLTGIIDKPYHLAFRRPLVYFPKYYNDYLLSVKMSNDPSILPRFKIRQLFGAITYKLLRFFAFTKVILSNNQFQFVIKY